MEKTSGHSSRRVFVILMLAAVTLCMLLLAGCQKKEKPASSEANKLEEIMDRGVLKVGTTGDYQPMSYLDPDTGEYVGFVDTPHG
jgi:cyclohexadienyl dehydratase